MSKEIEYTPVPRVTLDIVKRFSTKFVIQEDGCWAWKAAVSRGYGSFSITHRFSILAHRFSYLITKKKPEMDWGIGCKMTVDHLCRNRACVNPDHLELTTRGENVLRGKTLAATNKAKTRCIRNHLLTAGMWNGRKRRCGECDRIRGRVYDKARYERKRNEKYSLRPANV